MFQIVDSHVHLWETRHLSSLAWGADLPQNHVLNKQNSINEYLAASQSAQNLQGFVYIETDRRSSLRDDEWEDVTEEVGFVAHLAAGKINEGEVSRPVDRNLVLAIIPWAPIPAGATVLQQYVQRLRKQIQDGDLFKKIRGFRYLLQEQPARTMLQDDFLQALSWLGDMGYTFDLGIDTRSGGMHQLLEAAQLIRGLLSERGSTLKIIVDHMCKPDMLLSVSDVDSRSKHKVWADGIREIAEFPTVYIKLSGLFSEISPQQHGHPADIPEIVSHMKPWIDVVFSAFGPQRILFGSDWPVCNVEGLGPALSWKHWHNVVAAILDDQNLTDDQKQRVWSGTAIEAYGIAGEFLEGD